MSEFLFDVVCYISGKLVSVCGRTESVVLCGVAWWQKCVVVGWGA